MRLSPPSPWSATSVVLAQMAALTGGMVPLLLLLVGWVDHPLAAWLHAHGAVWRPLFALLTAAFDWWYEHFFQVSRLPLGIVLLAVAAGTCWRWQRRATALLLVSTLLTHVASKETVYHLKKWTSRLRPGDFLSTPPHAPRPALTFGLTGRTPIHFLPCIRR